MTARRAGLLRHLARAASVAKGGQHVPGRDDQQATTQRHAAAAANLTWGFYWAISVQGRAAKVTAAPGHRPNGGCLPGRRSEVPHDAPALGAGEIIDVELAAQVVGFVLQAAGQLAGSCHRYRLLAEVHPGHHRVVRA